MGFRRGPYKDSELGPTLTKLFSDGKMKIQGPLASLSQMHGFLTVAQVRTHLLGPSASFLAGLFLFLLFLFLFPVCEIKCSMYYISKQYMGVLQMAKLKTKKNKEKKNPASRKRKAKGERAQQNDGS